MIQDILLDVFNDTKSVVQQLGGLPCIAFPIEENVINDSFPIFFDNDIDKLKTFFAIGAVSYEKDYDGLILILDGCNRDVKQEDKEYFLKNLDIERPTLYPRTIRNNFVVIQFIDFIDSNHQVLLSEYTRKENVFSFSNPIFLKEIQSTLVELLIEGWNALAEQDEDEEESDEEDDQE